MEPFDSRLTVGAFIIKNPSLNVVNFSIIRLDGPPLPLDTRIKGTSLFQWPSSRGFFGGLDLKLCP